MKTSSSSSSINTLRANFLLLSVSDRTLKQSHCTLIKASASPPEKIEIRVCTNRTCRKQGSMDVLQVLTGIAPPSVVVNSCGCLGKCGMGPNIVILPEGVFVGHCGTPNKAAITMSYVCGIHNDDVDSSANKCLEALTLRKRAENEMGRGDFSQAYSLLSQAIDLKPFGGAHIIYKERSAVRLAMGDIAGALEDAKEVLALAPHYPQLSKTSAQLHSPSSPVPSSKWKIRNLTCLNFINSTCPPSFMISWLDPKLIFMNLFAYICKADVLMAMEKFDAAEESYSIALELDPSIRRSKSFKARITQLQEKLAPANLG